MQDLTRTSGPKGVPDPRQAKCLTQDLTWPNAQGQHAKIKNQETRPQSDLGYGKIGIGVGLEY